MPQISGFGPLSGSKSEFAVGRIPRSSIGCQYFIRDSASVAQMSFAEDYDMINAFPPD
jgi:hypothetical protein